MSLPGFYAERVLGPLALQYGAGSPSIVTRGSKTGAQAVTPQNLVV